MKASRAWAGVDTAGVGGSASGRAGNVTSFGVVFDCTMGGVTGNLD